MHVMSIEKLYKQFYEKTIRTSLRCIELYRIIVVVTLNAFKDLELIRN